uniref:Uncharacterized protein n=1 Tax=Meloidogyne javanica TaxID=6303 RepID=A0A915N2G4_MELJA
MTLNNQRLPILFKFLLFALLLSCQFVEIMGSPTSQLVRTALRAAKTAAIKSNTIGKVVEKMGAEAVGMKLKPPKPKEAPTTK